MPGSSAEIVSVFSPSLSSIFGQAAADADELAYLDSVGAGGEDSEEAYADPAIGTGRSLYTALMDTENEEYF